MYTKNSSLINRLRDKKVLIAAHRGTHGGNLIQNTFLSCKNAVLHGADIVEIDVIKSKDEKFFAFHNGEEKYLLDIKKDIRNMTSNQIKELAMINSIGADSGQGVEELEILLEKLRGKVLINIDRSWFYWKDTIEFLKSKDMKDQLIIKSPVSEDMLCTLEKSNSDLMYIPIIKSPDEWYMVKAFNINVAAVELIFESLDDSVVSSKFISELEKEGIILWVNAIKLNGKITLSAGLDDELSILEGYDSGWGKLIDMGFKIIQTDWPALLKKYINERCNN